jgi:hypothetical protein
MFIVDISFFRVSYFEKLCATLTYYLHVNEKLIHCLITLKVTSFMLPSISDSLFFWYTGSYGTKQPLLLQVSGIPMSSEWLLLPETPPCAGLCQLLKPPLVS